MSKRRSPILRLINDLARELQHFPDPVAEEKIVLEVVRRFGPPTDGNTDQIRCMICKAQGRPTYSWKHPWK